jgi:type 1 glutamine amidotransferase
MKQVAENYRPAQAGHPPGSNMCVWVKAAERTPVAYVQHGHDEEAWGNPAFKTLLLNSIKWAYSKDAKDWAHQHPAKIFA